MLQIIEPRRRREEGRSMMRATFPVRAPKAVRSTSVGTSTLWLEPAPAQKRYVSHTRWLVLALSMGTHGCFSRTVLQCPGRCLVPFRPPSTIIPRSFYSCQSGLFSWASDRAVKHEDHAYRAVLQKMLGIPLDIGRMICGWCHTITDVGGTRKTSHG